MQSHIAQKGKKAGQTVPCRARVSCRYGNNSGASAYVGGTTSSPSQTLDTAFKAHEAGKNHELLYVSLDSKGEQKFETTNLIGQLKQMFSNDIIVSKNKTAKGYEITENGRLIDTITYINPVEEKPAAQFSFTFKVDKVSIGTFTVEADSEKEARRKVVSEAGNTVLVNNANPWQSETIIVK
jgi:hypothetical protein